MIHKLFALICYLLKAGCILYHFISYAMNSRRSGGDGHAWINQLPLNQSCSVGCNFYDGNFYDSVVGDADAGCF